MDKIVDLDGAFLKGYGIKGNKVTDDYWYIKLSEIKNIREASETSCVFNTYKDSLFYCSLSEKELIKIINLYLFKPEEFAEIYVG